MKLLPVAWAITALLPLQALAQDAEVAKKWAGTKVVKYHVVGLYKARTMVVMNDLGPKGDVTDRITLEFTWDIKNRKILGDIKVTDGKSEVSNLKSEGTNCGPPQLKGDYEHFQSASSGLLGSELIEIKGTRIFPPAGVSNFPASCSMRTVTGGKEPVALHVAFLSELEVLAIPDMPGSPIKIAADRKSFVMGGAENWVWTYTPTRVQ